MSHIAKENFGESAGQPGLVSIIIPTYNRAQFITTALDSVLAQTYRPIECVVVDDGSSDNTKQVVENWGGKADPRFFLRYIKQENSGAPTARTRGMIESRGEFINYLDSDDYLLPDALRRKVACLQVSAAGYCYDRSRRVDDNGNTLGFFGLPWTAYGGQFFLVYHFPTTGPLIRRSVCERMGPWDNSIKGRDEVEYFARLKLHAGQGVFLDEIGNVIVEHAGPRMVGSDAHQNDFLLSEELVLKSILKAGAQYAHEARFLQGKLMLAYAQGALDACRQKDYHQALFSLRKASQFGYHPWHARLLLGIYRWMPSTTLARLYFAVRERLHSAKNQFSIFGGAQAVEKRPDSVKELYENLNAGLVLASEPPAGDKQILSDPGVVRVSSRSG